MNRQREVVYTQRRHIIFADSLDEDVLDLLDQTAQGLVEEYLDDKADPAEWSWDSFDLACWRLLGFRPEREKIDELSTEGRVDYLYQSAETFFKARKANFPGQSFTDFLRWMMLNCLDSQWKDHLLSMDHLKDGIGLRGYAQRDPLREYQREGFELFEGMLDRIRVETLAHINHVRVSVQGSEDDEGSVQRQLQTKERQVTLSRGDDEEPQQRVKQEPQRRATAKIGRNDPCPCGSGKKYKHCHGVGK
jgi:preprotein translocase subunit SecA